MALIARIHSADHSGTRVVRLRKGRNKLTLNPGERVEIVDETTGLAPETAHADRAGQDLVVTANDTTVRIESFYASAQASADTTLSLPGTGYAEVTPATSLLSCAAAGAATAATAAGAGGGLGTAALLGLGALALGGLTVAAGGGGGGGSTAAAPGQTSNTVPPAVPTNLDLAAADDSGASMTDNLTNVTTGLTITGNGEAGSTVQILAGTTVVGTGTVTAGGTFSIDIALPAGANTLTARASIAGGASSAASTALIVTVDTTAPVAPTALDLAAASDTGASSTDNLTSRTSGLAVSGTAEAGATVELFAGTTSLGTTTASATGAFSFTVALPAGVNTLTARATDAAGNVSAASGGLAITVDTTGPAAPSLPDLAAASDTGASSIDNVTSTTAGLVVSGTAEANGTVELFDGTSSLGTATVAADGAYTLTVALAAGAHSLTARAADAAGNTGTASAALAVTVDTTLPGAPTGLTLAAADDTGVSSSDGITSQTNGLTISGRAEAGATVQLFDGTTSVGAATADANGNFSLDISLASGTHTITARATDVAGNVGPASAALALTVDGTAPGTATIGSISGGAINAAEAAAGVSVAFTALETGSTRAVTLSGRDAAAPLTTLNLAATLDGAGNLQLTPAILARFADGSFTITAQQTDGAGNASSVASASAVLDRTAPTVSITSSNSALEFGQTATLTFTFTEAPVGFVAGDVSVTGGNLSGFAVTANPLVYTAILTPTLSASGPVVVTIANGSYTDPVDNAGIGGNAGAISYDIGTTGSAVDGYIAFALVFRDPNGNGVWDHEAFVDANNDGVWNVGESFTDSNSDGLFTAEKYTTTNAQGDFSNLTGTGRIVLTPLIAGEGTGTLSNLSRDISTGAVFTKQFAAPDGSTVVTPLTTLISAVAGTNATAAQITAAEATVKSALGISNSVDLKNFDPIAAATASGATGAEQAAAVEVQKIAVQVANVLNVVSTAASAAATATGSTVTQSQAAGAAASSLATQLTSAANSSTMLNLSNSAVVSQVISDVGTSTLNSSAQATLTAQSSSVSTALATVNEAVSNVSAGGNVNAALASVVATQIVAQVDLAGAVSNAVAGNATGAVLDTTAYSGTSLGNKVDTAGSQVQVIAPVETVPQALTAPGRPSVDVGNRLNGAAVAASHDISVTFDSTSGAQAGDTLKLVLGGTQLATYTLLANDIPAAGQSTTHTFSIAGGTFTTEGTQILSANFTRGATAGPDSLPVVLSVDTTAATPVVAVVSDGAVNVAEAAAGVKLSITGFETGATATVRLAGTDAVGGGALTLDVPRIDNELRLTSALLSRFADGTLTLTASQVDTAGNMSGTATQTFVLDRVAPATLAIGDVSGRFITGSEAAANVAVAVMGIEGGLTPAVTVSGTATGGGSLTLNVAGGNLTPTQLAQFVDGTLTFRATQTDAAGNSSAVATTTAVLSRVAAAPPTIGDISGGTINRAEALSNVTFTLSDVASGNTPTVRLSGGGLSSPITLTDSGGTYTLTTGQLLGLADGTYQVTAFQTDAGNQVSGTVTRSLVIDTNNPGVANNFALRTADDSGASNSDGITNRQVLTLTGTGEAGATVQIYDGMTLVGTGVVGTNGGFAVSVARPEGTSNFTARLIDAAGNASGAVGSGTPVAVTIDTTAPGALTAGTATADNIVNTTERGNGITVSFGTPVSGATISAQISGTAAAGGALTLNIATAAINQTTGVVTLDSTTLNRFAQGSVSLTARQTDLAGNVSTAATRAITIDTVANAPGALALLAADDTGTSNSDRLTNRGSVTITGTAEAGATVDILNGATVLGTATANGSGVFSVSGVTLANGANALTARQTDVAGNVSGTSALSITRDATAPAAPTALTLIAADDSGSSNSDRLTNRSSVTITGTAEANSTVAIFNGATQLGTATANGSGQFSISGVALANGANNLVARATDAAGNTGADSAALVVTRDSTAPANATIGGAALADTIIDASERFSGVSVTGTEMGATVAASVTGIKNGAPVTVALTSDTISRTWGTNGVLNVDFGSDEFSRALTVLADGRIIVAGTNAHASGGGLSSSPLNTEVPGYAAMLNADGTLDTSFGTAGKASFNFATGVNIGDDVRRIIPLQGGGFLVVGQTFSGTNSAFVGKLTATGATDTSFGTNGAIRFGTSTGGLDAALNASQQADGKILIAARLSSATGTLAEIATIRLNADGTFDSTFGTNGIARSGFASGSRSTFAAELTDGHILNIGFGNNQLIVSRLNSNGTPDTTFGTNGRLNLSSPSNVNFVGQPTVDAQGRIVIAGYGVDPATGANTGSFVARLTATGTLDTSFGVNGFRAIPTVAGFETTLFQVAIDSTGAITVGGSSSDGLNGSHATLARLTANGAIDTSFDGNGILITKAMSQVLGLQVTSTGAILAIAGVTNPDGTGDVGVLRIEPGQTGGFRLTLDDQLAQFDGGALTVTVTQTDAAGNVGTTTRSLSYAPQTGSPNADGIRGTAGNDTITGGAGNDYILPGNGNDSVDGGADRDTVSFTVPASVTTALESVEGTGADAGSFLIRSTGTGAETLFKVTPGQGGAITVQALGAAVAAGTDTLSNVEALEFTGTNIAGVTLSFVFDPSTLPAGAVNGSYTIEGSVLADTINVGTIAPNLATTAQVTVNGGIGNDTITGSVAVDTLNGGAGDDSLSGLAGNDFLNGGAGNDTLSGGADTDTLNGGEGNDSLDGGAGTDYAQFYAPAGLTGTLRAAQGTGADAGNVFVERVSGATVEQLFKIIPGGSGAATVIGLNSAAAQGTDTVTSVDRLDFGIGTTTSLNLFLTTSAGAFNANTPPTASLFGTVASETLDAAVAYPGLLNTQNVNIFGAAGNDALIGHDGGNYFEGGLGDDSIDGKLGGDTAGFGLVAGTTGTLRAVDGTGADSAVKFIERVDGATVEQLFRIVTNGNGTITVTGLNGGGVLLGTDTLTGIENLNFYITGGQNLGVGTNVTVTGPSGGVATINGSALANILNVATLVPSAASTDLVNINGNAGNDTIVGRAGAGVDNANYFNAAITTGVFVWSVADGTGADAGKLLVGRTNGTVTETLFRVTLTSVGAATVESLGSSVALTGTDTVTNIENLNFNGGGTSNIGTSIQLATIANAINNNFAQVNGSVFADTIDLDTLYSNPASTVNLNVNAGRGNDTITGSAGGNYLEGAQGNDSIDGGAGGDTSGYQLAVGTAGTYRQVAGTGADAGNLIVERVDGATVEQVLRVSRSGGTVTVTGLGSAAFLGTDTLTNVEQISVGTQNASGPTLNQIFFNVLPSVNGISNNNAFITGTAFGETLNLTTAYPGLADSVSGNVNAGAGDDTIIGHGGSDFISGEAGNDSIDGGAGFDTANFTLAAGITGTLRATQGTGADAAAWFLERVDGGGAIEQLVRVTKSGGTVTATGLNSLAGAGTDTLTNVEQVNVNFSNFMNPVSLQVAASANALFNNGANGQVNGGVFADTIDVAALYGNIITPATFVGVSAGAGNDTIVGHTGQNQISGDAGNDSIDGGGGSDQANWFIPTAGGNLVQAAGANANQILINRVDGQTTETVFQINLTASGAGTVVGLGSAASFGTDTFTRIGALSFGIQGGNGVYFNSGVTYGVNQQGNNFVTGSQMAETIDVGALLPALGSNAQVNVFTGAGDDTLVGGGTIDSLSGGDGDDTLRGNGGNDSLQGGNGTDIAIYSGNRADYTAVRDPQNNNRIVVTDLRNGSPDGTDFVDGFDVETLRFADGDIAASSIGATISGNGQVNGTPGNDTIAGGSGNDFLYGDGGDDELSGGAGNDYINGAGGNDVAVFSGNRADYTIITNPFAGEIVVIDNRANSPDGTDTVGNTTDRLRFADQTITLAGTVGQQLNAPNSASTLTGGNGDDYLNGSQFADTLNGGNGDDTIFAGDGNDSVNGGLGDDSLTGWNGNDTVTGGGGADAINGNDGDDTLIGGFNGNGVQGQAGDLGDQIFAGNGNDVLRGGDGDDRLFGDDGDDNLRGDAGSDQLHGGAGHDYAAYRFDEQSTGLTLDYTAFRSNLVNDGFSWADGRGGTDQLDGVEALILLGTSGNDIITGSNFTVSSGTRTANQLSGFDGNDTITGQNDYDRLFGGAGNDTLNGAGGNDELQGDDGNDAIDGGNGTDTAYYSGKLADYSIVRSGSTVTITDLRSGSPDGTDTLTNVEKLSFASDDGLSTVTYTVGFSTGASFIGTAGDDGLNNSGLPGLFGGADVDLLIGNGGADYLRGNQGNDLILGGAGRDTAAYSLPQGTTGTLRVVDGTGADAGKLIVQLVNGQTVTDYWRISYAADGSTATVEGLGSMAAAHGVDSISGVEQLDFFIDQPNFDPPPQGQYVGVLLAPFVPTANNGAFVSGSVLNDTIDLDTQYGTPAGANFGANGDRGDDTISGTSGSNGLQGGLGNDTLNGRGGDDFLQGNEGADTLNGGSGNDIAQFVLASGTTGTLQVVDGTGADAGKLIVQLVNGTPTDIAKVELAGTGAATVTGLGAFAALWGTDTVTTVEQLHFYVPNQVFDPTQFVSVNLAVSASTLAFNAGIGSNVANINGSEGADTVTINAALVAGLVNTDRVDGQFYRGNDVVTGHDGINFLNGGAGNDTINGMGGDDGLTGDAGNDTLSGGAGNDYIQGGAGNDIIDGGNNGDGSRGNDTSGYALAADTVGTLSIIDGTGNDAASQFVVRSVSGSVVETLFKITITGPGAATVEGLGARAAEFGTDTVTNTENLNFFISNSQVGGTGMQLYPNVNTGSTPNFIGGTGGADTLSVTALIPGVANGTAVNVNGNQGNDTITGHDGINFLQGGTGDDSINGAGGDDTLAGEDGNDTLDGGAGFDITQFVIPSGTTGTIVISDDSATTLTVRRTTDGGFNYSTLFTINLTGSNSATVTGNGIMSSLGTDTVSNIERLSFFISGGGAGTSQQVNFALTTPAISNNFAQVTGSVNGETIDLGALYPGAATNVTLNALGFQGNDTIIGTGGNNTLSGGSGDDTLSGLAGNDSLQGGPGSDTIDGGAGSDTLDYNFQFGAPTQGVTFSLANFTPGSAADSTVADPLGGTDTYRNVELVRIGGTVFADTLTGALGAPNTLNGNAGNDTLTGGNLNDTIDGGAGSDTIDGGAGSDILLFDHTSSTTGVTINASGVLFSSATASTAIDASGSTDTVRNIEQVTVNGSSAADTVIGSLATANFLFGNGGNDSLTGGNGDDRLDGGAGDDSLTGGGGNDVAVYSFGGSTAITFSAATLNAAQSGTLNGGTQFGTDTLIGIEAVNVAGSSVADTLTGSSGNDNINGQAGDDTLSGLAGNDTLTGGLGADTLNGGDGNDTLIGGLNTGFGAQAGDLADILNGGNGNDVIRGGDGDDQLFGDDGDDNLRGDAGSDLLNGGNGNDFASYFFTAATQGVTADFSGFTPGQMFSFADPLGGTDTLTGIETLGIGGSNFDDTLRGGEAVVGTGTGILGIDRGYANQMGGNAGNDAMFGGAGEDRLEGGTGNDSIDGRGGYDFAAFNFAATDEISGAELFTSGVTFSAVALDGSGSAVTLNAGALGTDTLTGIEGVVISGSRFGDTLTGGSAFDILSGGDGNDTVSGGAGDDFLSGDGGNDQLFGEDGTDTAVFSGTVEDYDIDINRTTGVVVITDLRSGSPDGTDTLTGVEKLRFTGTTPPLTFDLTTLIRGTDGNDLVTGTSADNLIAGEDGNDFIRGGAGNDQLFGGDGDDSFDEATDAAGDDYISGGDGNDAIYDFVGVNTVFGGNGNDRIGAAGIVHGGLGNDSIQFLASGPSLDTVYGDAGADVFIIMPYDPTWAVDRIADFSPGASPGEGDQIVVSYLVDQMVGWGGGFAPTLFTQGFLRFVQSGTDATLQFDKDGSAGNAFGFVDEIVLSNHGTTSLAALQAATTLFASSSAGTAGNNTITGTTGNDGALRGYAGDDTINGLAGNDYIEGGDGNDTIDAGDGDDIVEGDYAWLLTGGADTITGGLGNDRLFGLAGDDTIDGGDGNDFIVGGLGKDMLTGGAGADTFGLGSTGSTLMLADLITDFTAADGDKLQLGPGLSFAGLTFTQAGADTQVSITADGSYLAVLSNVTATDLTAQQFMFTTGG